MTTRHTHGGELHNRRVAAGLSRAQLAALIGVTERTIGRWEDADAVPPVRRVSVEEALRSSTPRHAAGGEDQTMRALERRLSLVEEAVGLLLEDLKARRVAAGLAPPSLAARPTDVQSASRHR